MMRCETLKMQIDRNEALAAASVSTAGLAMVAVGALLRKRSTFGTYTAFAAGAGVLAFSMNMFGKACSPLVKAVANAQIAGVQEVHQKKLQDGNTLQAEERPNPDPAANADVVLNGTA